MKFIFVIPPSKLTKSEIISTQYPINIGYISAILKKKNYEVELWDYNVETFCIRKFKKRIINTNPDILGFSCMSLNINSGNTLAKKAKELNSDILCIVAGSHSTAFPVETLIEFKGFDLLVYGESEKTIEKLSKKSFSRKSFLGIKGLCYKNSNDEIIINSPQELISNLDTIPFPDRNLGNLKNYKKSHVSRGISRKFLNISEMIVSRGCPYSCIFCASHLSYGKKVRYRSIKNVFEEIDKEYREREINHISFIDDVFTFNREFVTKFCNKIRDYNITWDCNTRVDLVDYRLLKLMRESGLVKISFGVESGSQRILNLNKKNITIPQIKMAFKNSKKAGIKLIEGVFIIGSHFDETKNDLIKTTKLIKLLNLDLISVGIIAPLPGTEIYHLMNKKKLLTNRDWTDLYYLGEKPKWRTNHFSAEELVYFQKKILKSFYYSPFYLLKRFRKINSLSEFLYWVRIGMESLKWFLKDFFFNHD